MKSIVSARASHQRARFHLGVATLLTATFLLPMVSNPARAAEDALEASAVASDLVSRSLLLDVTKVGKRLVAVGERGHILFSDDTGLSWHQAKVPVRVTLTAVSFPTSRHGWAVGHDGVILHSNDGGETWRKQLDGHQINELVEKQAQDLLADAEDGVGDGRLAVSLEDMAILAEDAQVFLEEGPTRPLLDVSFHNAREGIAVGAFGLILQTRDGGASWQSLLGQVENAFGFHHYAVERLGGTVFVAGEAGGLHRSRDGGEHWERLESPYEGSYFGLVGDASRNVLIVYGLRGHVFHSRDEGDTWQRVQTPIDASVEGGAILPDGSALLVGHGGVLLNGKADDLRFTSHHLGSRGTYSAVTGIDEHHAIIVGQGGIHRVARSSLSEKVN